MLRLSINSLFSDLPCLTVTALHFESIMDLPLSLFSSCCHLESLTLVSVSFANTETLSGSLFPSLRRLSILSPWLDDDHEAFGVIMTQAAPTLTTLNLSETNARYFLNFKSTIIFPVLESIQASSNVSRYDAIPVLRFLSRLLKHSTPMLAQIQIECSSNYKDNLLERQQPLAKGFSPIDEILSSPTYRGLKTLDLVFVDRYLYSDLLEVRTFINKILPAVSSRSQVEIKITTNSPQPRYTHLEVHFVF
ncbi:hypothetical protein BYT27DRAFT_7240607 [Phlegmacium glaucopus]|nr:hypothetical protein BYT27DRAFT_7240607 [Phlegmacium glaucopus]